MDVPSVLGTDNTNCVGASGYVGQNNAYEKCTGVGTSSAIDYVIKTGSDCTGMTNGDLIKVSSEYKICINGSTTPLDFSELTVNDSKSYFVDAGNENVFNNKEVDGHYVAVTIEQKSAVVDKGNNKLSH